MSALLVGYARVSAQDQDLTAQRDALAALGVPVARTYVDHGLDRDQSRSSGTARARWPPVAAEIPWSSRSSTDSHDRCPTPATSSKTSRRARSS